MEGFMEEVALQLVGDISLSTQETESYAKALGSRGTPMAELLNGSYWGGPWSYRCEINPKLRTSMMSG